MDLGVDEKTGERLYTFHPRRAQQGSLRKLLPVFRKSAIAKKLAKQTATKKRPNGVRVGLGAICKYKCPCVKKPKPAECACLKCTYIISNVARVHLARPAWHRARLQRKGGSKCVCHIHPKEGCDLAAAEFAAACGQQEEALRCSLGEGADATAVEQWQAALARADAAQAEAEAEAAKVTKAHMYDQMLASLDALTAALMPCGKDEYPDYSIFGSGPFRAYKKRCIFDDCPKKLFCRSEACGFDSVFGKICPTEANDEQFSWQAWEKRIRGVNDEGKPFHSMEWVPRHGTKREFWNEFLPALKENFPHVWRERMIRQGRRIYEDRKSGHHRDELVKRRRTLEVSRLLYETFDVVVQVAEQQLDSPVWRQPSTLSRRLATLRIIRRHALESDLPSEAAVEAARRAAARAEEVYAALSRTATIQSDYASQLQTSRAFHATCAIQERHNYLVSLVGYKSRAVTRKRPRKHAQPQRYVSSTVQPGAMEAGKWLQPPAVPPLAAAPSQPQPAAAPPLDPRQTTDYEQQVDIVFAFHKAGFKPNARSYNVTVRPSDRV